MDRQYANYVGYVPMEMSEVVPIVGCSGSLLTGSPDQLCAARDNMTCWDTRETMSDDSYDSYEGVDGQPGYVDYDDPRGYKEWCAWNDVDEDEEYYARSHRMWRAGFFRPRILLS